MENELFEGRLHLFIVLKAWKNKFNDLLPNLNGTDWTNIALQLCQLWKIFFLYNFFKITLYILRWRKLWDLYAPINGLPQDGGGGQPMGIWLREALPGWGFWQPQRSPGRVENLTRLPSWKVERVWKWVARHLGNTQKSFGWASHILCLAFLFMSDGRTKC